jgi:thioredoxin reductase (NADPH)
VDTDAWLWAASLATTTAIVAPAVICFRRRRHRDRARKQEAVRLGADRPVGQYPFIDAARCIGCGACVEACPEGDVLGIIGGTATVVDGLHCMGHGRCELACPVGAIEVGLGDVKSRRDLPVLDAWQESSVPGLFVAGELAGLSLIRNAAAQARKVADRVAQLAAIAPAHDVLDLLIVGAGPAGLTAAATACAHGLSTAVLEQEHDLGGAICHYPRRKLVLSESFELPLLGRLRATDYSKEELLALFQELCRRAELRVRFGQRVLSVDRHDGLFCVRSPDGETTARYVCLAAGRRGTARKLGVPGEELPKVMYQLVDAASFHHMRLLVVGGGDSAVEAVIGLSRQPGNDVTLCYRREKLVRVRQKNAARIARLLDGGRVRGLFSSQLEQIRPGDVRVRTPEGPLLLANDYVLICAGGEPPLELLRNAGVRLGGDPEQRP